MEDITFECHWPEQLRLESFQPAKKFFSQNI